VSQRVTALVLDDGDLGQVRDALDEIDARVVYRRDRTIQPDMVSDFDLLVTSGRRALAWKSPLDQLPAELRPLWFAFHNQDFLPLRERLRRQGVDYLVHSTIDREVFRLLLHSVVFEGAGKRRVPRVPVGASVGWQSSDGRFPAMLAELGPLGCRLFSARAARPGERVRLELPAALCEGTPVEVQAQVVRVETRPRWVARAVLALEFSDLSERAIRIFTNLRAGRAIGARLSCLTGATLRRRRSSAPGSARALAAPPGLEEPPKERRVFPRVSLRGQGVTLLADRARTTAGQNLSLRALRVTRLAGIALGESLRVALPRPRAGAPLLLPARVARDDGAGGLLLRFESVPQALAQELDRLIASLPPLLSIGERDGASAIEEPE